MPPTWSNNLVVVFDLDDTLCQEIDFLTSAYTEIADLVCQSEANRQGLKPEDCLRTMLGWYHQKENVFERVLEMFPDSRLSFSDLLELYRAHFPQMTLNPGARELLDLLKSERVPLGLITDGRSRTQRNKLGAMGIAKDFELIVISEEFGSQKPDARNYQTFAAHFPGRQFVYIGDNVHKDFVTPNQLGWTTIALLDRGQNIHPQSRTVDERYRPHFVVESLADCPAILKQVHQFSRMTA